MRVLVQRGDFVTRQRSATPLDVDSLYPDAVVGILGDASHWRFILFRLRLCLGLMILA